MILKQAEHYLDESKRLNLAKLFVKGAILNIEKVLNYYEGRGINLRGTIESISLLKSRLNNAVSCEGLMALEGNIRDIYYRSFAKIIKSDDFTFESRSKRPPENRLNALISFGNSLLYTIVLSEIYKTHLDPRIGFLHATNFRRFTLNLDVAEVFKPIIVDRLIFTLLNKEMIKKNHFDEKLKGVYLKEKGRIIFVEELEKRLKTTIKHPSLGKNISYRQLIRIELYKIEKHLLGEKEYEPFTARW
jgi:CRISPR-associated protein Cas1